MRTLMRTFGWMFVVAPLFAATMVQAGPQVLVVTGGAAERWRFQLSDDWGEHLIFGPDHLLAARTYFYKGLLNYTSRFERYLEPWSDVQVKVVDLDRESLTVSFTDYAAVVLDDVRADAIKGRLGDLRRYVEGGGRLLIAAGSHGFGGNEIQKWELPTLPNALLFDPPDTGSFYTPVSWAHFSTMSSYRHPDFEALSPVTLISQPDLVVYDRETHGGGRILTPRQTNDGSALRGVPLEDWPVVGFHKTEAKPDASVWATVGPDDSPLVVWRNVGAGRVLAVTADELTAAIRLNGPPSNASLNNPVAGAEFGLWEFDDILWRTLLGALLERTASVEVRMADSVAVGLPLFYEVEQGGSWEVEVRRIGDDDWFRYAGFNTQVSAAQGVLNGVAELPEGRYRAVFRREHNGEQLGSALFDVQAVDGFALSSPLQFAVAHGGERTWTFSLNGPRAAAAQLKAQLVERQGGGQVASTLRAPSAVNGEESTFSLNLRGDLLPGEYLLHVTAELDGRPVARQVVPVAVVASRDVTPDLFLMIAGTRPSFHILNDLRNQRAEVTLQYGPLRTFLPYAEYFGGMPRAPHLTDNLPLRPEHRWQNWKGEHVPGGNGGAYSWALEEVLAARDENLIRFGELVKDVMVTPVFLFDDEPAMPMNGGWEAADDFKARFGIPAPIPEPRYDDADYMQSWMKWSDFRASIWAQYYERGTKAVQSARPDLQSTVVVEGMGKCIYAGFEPTISQEPLDIYWFHIYPINEPLTMVGHAVERGMSALRAMGRTERERYALLQNWAAVGEVPQVPGPDYIRNQYWMAVAHGATGIGYWPYAYGWWSVTGTPGWDEMGIIAERQSRLMPVWKALRSDRQPIALLYSQSQGATDHLKGLLAETPQDSARPWRNYHNTDEAYHTLKQAGLPFEIMEERELMRSGGEGLPYKAIVLAGVEFLRAETREALRQFQAQGGRVYMDEASLVEWPGRITIPTRFDNIFTTTFPEDPKWFNWLKHRDDYQDDIEQNIAAVRSVMDDYSSGDLIVSGESVVWNTLAGGDTRYLFVVNNSAHTPNLENYRHIVQGWRLTPVYWNEVTAELRVRGVQGVYDVDAGQIVDTRKEGDYLVWERPLASADGAVYALLKEWPGSVRLSVQHDPATHALRWSATLLNEVGGIMDVVLPVKARWSQTEAGDHVAHAAFVGGTAEGVFPLGVNVASDEIVLEVEIPGMPQTRSASTVRIGRMPDQAQVLR